GLDAPEALTGDPDALRAWLMEQLTVSVIVTAYNHAADIGRCLDAVLGQRGLFRLQVVIGDDKSTDGTAEIVERYRARDPER
ncbi:glycosyltransferase, partial [Mameliella sp. CS4]